MSTKVLFRRVQPVSPMVQFTLQEVFSSLFLCTIFFQSTSLAWFFFCFIFFSPPFPPITFLMVRPLILCVKSQLLSPLPVITYAVELPLHGSGLQTFFLIHRPWGLHAIKNAFLYTLALFHQDIAWQLKFLSCWNGCVIILDPYWSRPPDLALFTDASGTLGIYYNGHWIADSWPAILRDCLIQWRSSTPLPFPAFWRDTCGQGRRFSSSGTISLWWISGPLVYPKTLISSTLFAQYSSLVQLTILES